MITFFTSYINSFFPSLFSADYTIKKRLNLTKINKPCINVFKHLLQLIMLSNKSFKYFVTLFNSKETKTTVILKKLYG